MKVRVDKGANEIMDIVRMLRSRGLVQGVDFDFSYIPTTWSTDGFDIREEKHTMFTFYKETHGMLFAIEYSK